MGFPKAAGRRVCGGVEPGPAKGWSHIGRNPAPSRVEGVPRRRRISTFHTTHTSDVPFCLARVAASTRHGPFPVCMAKKHVDSTHARPPESEGQRQLLALDMSASEIGAVIGVSGETARRWRRGEKVPHERRGAIQVKLGIPAVCWERAPRTPTPAEALASSLDPAAIPAEAKGLDALITQLEGARQEPNLSAVTLAKLGGVEVRAREAAAKCRSWDEAAIIASPAWHALKLRILDSLRPWPDAIRAMAAALQKNDAAG
jgi:hypothetical protein